MARRIPAGNSRPHGHIRYAALTLAACLLALDAGQNARLVEREAARLHTIRRSIQVVRTSSMK